MDSELVTAAQIAKHHGIHRTWVLQLSRKRGVTPVIDKPIRLWRREDVPKLRPQGRWPNKSNP